MNFSEKEILLAALNQAFIQLYENDRYLIINDPHERHIKNHVSERGIVFRFGIYLQEQLLNRFSEYHLDAEYNRNIYERKNLKDFPNGTYPDLIIHKRGLNNDNLLVIEFKTWWNNNTQDDKDKIQQFLDPYGEYKYKYGLIVTLNQDLPLLEWIEIFTKEYEVMEGES